MSPLGVSWEALGIILAMAVAGFLATTWLVRRYG